MTYLEAYEVVTHPGRDRWLFHAREDNPDPGQRDAARATLLRLAGEPQQQAADARLREDVARWPCCP